MNTKITTFHRFTTILALSGLFVFSVPSVGAQVFDPSSGKVIANDPTPPINTALQNPDAVSAINSQIEANQKHIDDLNQQIADYKVTISQTQGQITDLQTQIKGIENQITLSNLDIQAKQAQLDSLSLEIRSLQLSIDTKTADVNAKKVLLADSVRQLDASSRTTPLAMVMNTGSFSDFYSQAQAQAEINVALQQTISTIKQAKQELQTKQDELSKVKDNTQLQKLQLQDQQQSVEEQKTVKDGLLSKSQETAKQYSQLLDGSQNEVDQANAAISTLQASLQSKLQAGGSTIDLPSPSGFIWPVASRKINATFLDPTYHMGGRKHYGIDIGTDQGTPVKSTADGVVVGIRGADMSGAPSVVQIQNGGGFVTYYLHMHKIFVAVGQNIKQGDVIGYSGGQCSTAGAGTCGLYTTGAHLHYEMHLNNAPVNPLAYLP